MNMKNTQKLFIKLYLILIFSVTSTMGIEFGIVVIDKKGRSTKGTIVELVGKYKSKAKIIEIKQEDKEFNALVSIVPLGSTISFFNNDSVKHHVYSVSKGNKFDIPLYSGNRPKKITFTKPGVVKIGCNIHDWMLTFAYISQSKYIALVDENGKVSFSDIPKGKYKLHVWNPKFKNNKKVMIQSITINKNGVKKVKVSLLKKIRKPRRDILDMDDSVY